MRLPFSPLFALEHILWQSAARRLTELRYRLYPKLPRGLVFEGELLLARSEDEARTLFAHARLPVLWKGGANSTLLMRWTPDYLRAVAGEIKVKILTLPGLAEQTDEKDNCFMPLSRYLDEFPTAKAYLRFSDLVERCDILKADLPFDLLQRVSAAKSRVNLQFFLGSAGARTPLHAEMNCNIFIQIFGTKRWLVLPASATPELAVPAARRFYFFSGVDAFACCTPAKRPLRGVEIRLEPGDILLSPPLVWHAVENTAPSCSLAYKYNDYLRALRTSPLLFAMNTLARDPSYFTYLWHKLIRKRHLILSSE